MVAILENKSVPATYLAIIEVTFQDGAKVIDTTPHAVGLSGMVDLAFVRTFAAKAFHLDGN